MTRLLLLLSIIILFPVFLRAQPGSPASAHKTTLRVRFVREPSGFEKNANEILREIGKENLIDQRYVKIYIDADMHISAAASSGGERKYHVTLSADSLRARGEVYYRKFRISDVLLPSQLTLFLKWQNRSDSNQKTVFTFPSVASDNGMYQVNWQIDGFNAGTDTLIPGIMEVAYTTDDLNRFLARIQMINDYYASALLLDSIEKQISLTDAASTTLLPENYFRTDEIAKAVLLIQSKDFDQLIISGGNDPANMQSRLQEVYRKSRSIVYTYNETLERTATIPQESAATRAAGVLISGMMRYIGLSARMNDLNGAVYRQYLADYFNVNIFDPDDEYLKLTSRMYPGMATDSASMILSDTIFKAFVAKINLLIANEEFSQAFELLKVLTDFAENYSGHYTPGMVDSLESKAATGVFSSYLGIAQSCIGQGKFIMAENYMGRALEYRREYPLWIPSDSLYGIVFRQLFTRRLEACDQKFQAGEYSEAIQCYSAFEKSFKPGEVALVLGQINTRIGQARMALLKEMMASSFRSLKNEEPDSAVYWYEQAMAVIALVSPDSSVIHEKDSLGALVLPLKFNAYVVEGTYALERRNYGLAYSSFFSADSLAHLLNMETDSSFDAGLLLSFKYHLLDEISLNTGYIWNNRFDSAYAWIGAIGQEAALRGIGDDTVVALAIKKYKAKIEGRQCSNSREKAELLWIKANRNNEAGRYALAFRQADSVQNIISQFPSCHIAIPGIPDTIWKYQPAVNFQRLLDSIRIVVAIGNYGAAADLMTVAEKDWQDHKMAGFGFDTFRVYEFVKSRENINLTRETLDHYLQQADIFESFRYLYLLRIEGCPSKETGEIQAELGKLIAERDFRTDSLSDPLVRLAELCGTDDWYNTFRKAYAVRWKLMTSNK